MSHVESINPHLEYWIFSKERIYQNQLIKSFLLIDQNFNLILHQY